MHRGRYYVMIWQRAYLLVAVTSWWKRVSDCCLTPTQQFSAISWREQDNFHWDDDEVRFVLDQHAELDFYSASSLKQQSADRYVAQLGHIILIPSQPVCSHSLMLRAQRRSNKYQFYSRTTKLIDQQVYRVLHFSNLDFYIMNYQLSLTELHF
jgi:hypothetical protein